MSSNNTSVVLLTSFDDVLKAKYISTWHIIPINTPLTHMGNEKPLGGSLP